MLARVFFALWQPPKNGRTNQKLLNARTEAHTLPLRQLPKNFQTEARSLQPLQPQLVKFPAVKSGSRRFRQAKFEAPANRRSSRTAQKMPPQESTLNGAQTSSQPALRRSPHGNSSLPSPPNIPASQTGTRRAHRNRLRRPAKGIQTALKPAKRSKTASDTVSDRSHLSNPN